MNGLLAVQYFVVHVHVNIYLFLQLDQHLVITRSVEVTIETSAYTTIHSIRDYKIYINRFLTKTKH